MCTYAPMSSSSLAQTAPPPLVTRWMVRSYRLKRPPTSVVTIFFFNILSVCHFLPPVILIGYIFRDKDPLHLF